MIELLAKRDQLIDQMDYLLEQMHKHNVEAADAECDFKLALSKRSLTLRANNMPVNLIEKICYTPELAAARRKWLILKGQQMEDQEALNVCKIKIKSIEEEIKRAWVQT